MSVVRNNSSRSESRKQRSNPYGGRSIISGFLNFIGWGSKEERIIPPAVAASARRSRSPASEPAAGNTQNTDSRDTVQPLNVPSKFAIAPAPQTAHQRGSSNLFSRPNSPNDDDTTFISPIPFSFDAFKIKSLSLTPVAPPRPAATAPRTLTRNPNGPFTIQGAGSAKSSRLRSRSSNRIGSPAFGVPISKADNSTFMNSSEPRNDNKRRKFGDETPINSGQVVAGFIPNQQSATTPTPAASSQASKTPTVTTPARPNALASSSRPRTPAKPTAPVVPSPLRQAWSGSAGTSPREETKQNTHPTKQTETATMVAGLIKATTPPKKPDLSNPYQTANPVAKVGQVRRSKRARPAPKPSESGNEQKQQRKGKLEEEEKLISLTPQEILEATLPKGSKRSRPPAHLQKSSPPEVDLGPQPESGYVVEEPEESGRPSKKSKPSVNGNGYPSIITQKTPTRDITVEELEDVSMAGPDKEITSDALKSNTSVNSPSSNGSNSISRSSFKPSSIPKEPSKLRFSFQAEGSAPPSPAPAASIPLSQTTPSSLLNTDFKFSPPSSDYQFSFKVDEKPTSLKSELESSQPGSSPNVDVIKAKAAACKLSILPAFDLSFVGASTSLDFHTPRDNAKMLPKSILPSFTLEWASAAFSFNYDASKVQTNPRYVFRPSPPKQTKAPVPFPSSVNNGSSTGFTFGGSQTSPSLSPVPSSGAIKGFDFAAAGMKAPTAVKDNWLCSLCGISNASSSGQCQACETDRPTSGSKVLATASVSLPTPPSVKGFDFAAAGMKPPPTTIKDTWLCSLCGISNAVSSSKCLACETDRPSSASKVAASPAPVSLPKPPTVPVTGFNFAAAGMKTQTAPKDAWLCSICLLNNPLSAANCTVCDNPR